MPIVASVSSAFVGKLIIAGAIITLVGAVATIASLTPEYKAQRWDTKAQKIGYILGVPGATALLAGTMLELTSKNTELLKFETVGAAIVSLSVVIAFALPIARRARLKLETRWQRCRRAGAKPRSAPPP